jgi:hypothetical protein
MLVKKNELGQPFALLPFQREILTLAFAFDKNGRLLYDTVIYSTVKKSGKTTVKGANPLVGIHSGSAKRDSYSSPTTWSNPWRACSKPCTASSSTIPSSNWNQRHSPRPFI